MGEPEDEGNNGRGKVDHGQQVIFEESQPAFPRRIPMTALLQYELRPEPEHHPAPFLNAHQHGFDLYSALFQELLLERIQLPSTKCFPDHLPELRRFPNVLLGYTGLWEKAADQSFPFLLAFH